ncbi:hypothetical protein GH975_10205 [Litorivicinus lipolyticus]|uniref:Uncharacterized protein n=1 Tax=Litorivicinus lipolyticus TaxID=418701 RepID=A0A5Q2Q8D1_9GAMM|nr:hypothetical protein [Litorivicinus lipolyticus]QGG80919.1 hypothetical protein GH975_10205 [Litorivicinus lipolyticus]
MPIHYTVMTDPRDIERHAAEFAALTLWFDAKKRQLGLSETPDGDYYDMHHPYNRHAEALFKQATVEWQTHNDYTPSPGQLMAAFFALPNPNRRVSMDA